MKTETKKFFLLASSFLAGFCLMTLELVSPRIIAPMVGSSVYTWTSVIGVTLLGLTVGSFLGGLLADKYSEKVNRVLFIILTATSGMVIIIPFLKNYTDFILDSLSSLPLINILLSILLFLPSAMLLGTIQPLIFKLYSENHTELGKRYGSLSAVWSMGSIIGVFLTGFYFIPNLGSSSTIIMIAIILFVNGLYFLDIKDWSKKNLFITFFFFSLIFCTPLTIRQISNPKIIYQKETSYYNARVVESKINNLPAKFLFLDADSHSVETSDTPYSYTALCPVLHLLKKDASSMYYIGGGSYSMPKFCSEEMPQLKMLVSEIDPTVEEIAKKYFNLNNQNISTVIGDARINLSKSTSTYDIIFGDAYNSFISVPWYLLTTDFNTLISKRLNKNGIYAVNFIGTIKGDGEDLFKTILKTLSSTFKIDGIFTFGTNNSEPQNIVIFCSNKDSAIRGSDFLTMLEGDKELEHLIPYEVTSSLVAQSNHYAPLTDDFAPTENIISPLTKKYWSGYRANIKKILQ